MTLSEDIRKKIKEENMKLRFLAVCVILSTIMAGCGSSKTQENTPNSVKQTESETESGTDSLESTAPSGAEITLTPEDITGSVVDGKYYIETINTNALNIRIPDEIDGAPVVSTEGYMFAVSDIESIVFPDSMESIGEAMFNACDKLSKVELGKSLKHMGSMAFNGCSALEKVTFPEGMETFDDVIFFNCKNLKEVYVPASVTEFGENTPVLDPETCPDAVVVTPAGSPAEKICTEKGIPVRAE